MMLCTTTKQNNRLTITTNKLAIEEKAVIKILIPRRVHVALPQPFLQASYSSSTRTANPAVHVYYERRIPWVPAQHPPKLLQFD